MALLKRERERERGEMEREEKIRKIHILVIPFPVQGHINPMLQFSKRLASKGLRVTLLTTTSISNTMQPSQTCSTVKIEPISAGLAEGEESIDAFIERFKVAVAQSLGEFIDKQNGSDHPAKVLVYDSAIPWALDIAQQRGLYGASFFTQSCIVSSIYYHVHQGTLQIPIEAATTSLPSMPRLGIDDMPSFICDVTGSYPSLLSLVLNQFSNVQKANWLFFNTFDKLEGEVLKWLASQLPIKTIGPTIPSTYTDKRVVDDKDYGLNLFKPDADACMEWLDTKEVGSVVYMAFGSLAALAEEQMEELAWGLRRSNINFLWVVRESELKKLPSNFKDETLEKGLVVTWCPQLDVLAHKAIGCFVTHCGWNSTLEALSLGVPMVAMPQWTDQKTNAKFVQDVWQVGVRVKVDGKGIVSKEEVELCIREVMEGERGIEIKKNAARWKELAKEAVNEGGSSDKNIEEFVANLVGT